MSQFTDWFIANPDEAKSLIRSDDPMSHWKGTSLEGIIDSDLMELAEYLNSDFSDFDLLVFDPMVFEISPAFIAALAAVEIESIAQIAEAWKTREGMNEHSTELLTAAIHSLRNLCLEATSTKASVLQVSAG